MSLRELKPPPLLEPPLPASEFGWTTVPEGSIASFAEMVLRGGLDCANLGECHVALAGLGRRLEVPESQWGTMAEALAKHRKDGNALLTASLLFSMNALGRPQEITQDDTRLLCADLDRYRANKTGLRVAELHYRMHGIGVGVEITPADRKTMVDAVGQYRLNGDGLGVAAQHYYLMKLGFKQEIKMQDWALMRKRLEEESRFVSAPGLELACMVSELAREAGETRPANDMPPLKRFTR